MIRLKEPQKDRAILIVEDSPTQAEQLRHLLEENGYSVAVASNGGEALIKLAEQRPLLIISDIVIPVMDGYAMCANINKDPELKEIPVMLLTSLSEAEDVIKGLQCGADNFIGKPYDQEYLLARIEDIITTCALRKNEGLQLSILFQFGGTTLSRTDANIAQSPRQTLSEGDQGKRAALRILLAEDNRTNQEVALAILRHIGYTADVAANGLEVLESLRRQDYDLVFMDVQMPEMDGLETTRQIRTRWPGELGPQIIAMTANAMQDDQEKCLAAGMDGYISKPITIGKVKEALSSISVRSSDDDFVMSDSALETLDESVLGDLGGLQEGVNLAARLVRLYFEDAPLQLKKMRDAILCGNAEALMQAAHLLKGNSASLGGQRLAAFCAKLEHRGTASRLADAEPLLVQLESEFELFHAALEARYNIHSTRQTILT